MKTILFCGLAFLLILACQSILPRQSITVQPVDQVALINFKSQIQPILEKRCSPCHFTGGKMHEKMPFDSATTLIKHREGILKRIKEEPDNNLLREFLKQEVTN